MNWKYSIVGIIMVLIGGLLPFEIWQKIPYGFVLMIALLFFGVIVIITGIKK